MSLEPSQAKQSTVAWNGTPEEFWKCIDHVRSDSDTEGDAAVLGEILYLAQCAILQLGTECEHVAKLARVEALASEWRRYAASIVANDAKNKTIARVRNNCADELEQALRGNL